MTVSLRGSSSASERPKSRPRSQPTPSCLALLENWARYPGESETRRLGREGDRSSRPRPSAGVSKALWLFRPQAQVHARVRCGLAEPRNCATTCCTNSVGTELRPARPPKGRRNTRILHLQDCPERVVAQCAHSSDRHQPAQTTRQGPVEFRA